MPLPESVTTIPLHIRIVAPDGGRPAMGQVIFSLPHALRDGTGNVVIGNVPPIAVRLDANGEATVSLIATDDPDLSPSGWAYTVEVATDVWRDRFQIQVPAGSGALELADLAPAVTPPDLVTYVLANMVGTSGGVASLDGTGNVPLAQLGNVPPTPTAASLGAVATSTATTKGDLLVATAAATIGRLGVGADGQALTADSSQAAGARWAAPFGRVWRSGSRYAPQTINLGTGTPGQNEVRYIPIWVPSAAPIAEIAAEVTTAGSAGAVARLIIAAAGADGRPGSIVYCSAALPATATGKISAAPAVTLAPGRYFFALVSQGAPTTAPIFRTVSGVPEMYEQPSMPNYLRCGYSAYGQSGNVTGVGGLTIDAADGPRVEVLVG